MLTLNYPPKSKKVYSIFSKIAGLGSAIKIFRYNNLSGANSHAVCVLAPSLKKTGGSLLEKNLLIYCLLNGFLVAIAFLKANAVAFKPPNSKLFGYRQIA